MPATAMIENVSCSIEKLSDGRIRVMQTSPQFNAMNGPATGGMMEYMVHPCQKHQYQMLNQQLPESEQAMPETAATDRPPWWSLTEGERAGLKD